MLRRTSVFFPVTGCPRAFRQSQLKAHHKILEIRFSMMRDYFLLLLQRDFLVLIIVVGLGFKRSAKIKFNILIF